MTMRSGVKESYFSRKMKWHKWFAWRPVTVWRDKHNYIWVWLETIERKYEWYGTELDPMYRLIREDV